MTRFGLILGIWAAGLAAAGQYAKVSVIFDQLPQYYPQAGPALGFLVSIVGLVGIILGVVAGLLVARVRPRRALIWALWTGALLGALQGLMPPLWLMLVLRALEGVSHLALVVAAPTLIGALSADRHRGLTMTLWSTFFSVGFALFVYVGLPLVEAYGVPALFALHAAAMALCAALLTPLLPDIKTKAQNLSLPAILREHRIIYGSAAISTPAWGWLCYTFCFLAILTVLPPHIPPDLRGFVIGAMPLVSIAISMTLGVWALRYISAVSLMQIGFVLVIATLVMLLIAPGAPWACFALAAAFGIVQGAGFAAVPQLNPTSEAQTRAFGALAQMGNLGNTTGTPVLLAMVSLAGYAGLIGTSIAVFVFAVALFVWLAQRRALAMP